ncbi:hypothetical protein H6P81_008566 [Aristolochia fimbriata]|uniref:DNA topoisomerase n=1 Tax=Aristolochia fimbriata TaxID=158543 RepID=A0AAV7EL97_ARIFI|nr:hypothetical protein H6P81_008566 [Aristolochia fimbriata]
MALFRHRLFSTTSLQESFSNISRRPVMLHSRTLQNLPGCFVSYPLFHNGGRSRKSIQLKVKTVTDSCCISISQLNGLRLQFERGSCLLRGHSNKNGHGGSTLVSDTSAIYASRSLEANNGVKLSLPSYRLNTVRSLHGASTKKNNSVSKRVGSSGKSNSAGDLVHGAEKVTKPFPVHSSLDEGIQVGVPNPTDVGSINCSKSAVKGGNTTKSKKKAGKSGSSNQSTKPLSTKKQLPNSEVQDEQLPVTGVASATAGTKGPRRTARKKKSTDTAQTSPTVPKEMQVEGVTPLSMTDKQSKGLPQPSTKKKKNSSRKIMVMSSDHVSSKQSNPMVARSDGGQRTTQTEELRPLHPPSGKSVLVVESMTKANVIQRYLGDSYEVLPSYGHVRDLAARAGSVRPDDDFSMVWEVPSSAWTHLKTIKVALSGAQYLILATDPDREGEAIAWHLAEMLQQQDALHEGVTVARVVFHEITESSIKTALQSPRNVNMNLVQAYLTRRALDYLIGFNISPLLWKKLPGCQSAGRVQAAALALICDRESEIEEFKPREYWTVETEFRDIACDASGSGVSFLAHMTFLNSKKLEKFSISSQEMAKVIEENLKSSKFDVLNVKLNQLNRNSPAPYITSTLQQDAANKLHFSASYTMKLAQKLYEGVKLSDNEATGLITYMRTDGLHVSAEAVKDIQSLIIDRYGQNYASSGAKHFKRVKNAQEAHEAIRPTCIQRFPSKLVDVLDKDSLKLYTLIWSRTMASQMAPAIIEQIQVDTGNGEGTVLRSAASRIAFLGYQAVLKDKDMSAIDESDNEDILDGAFTALRALKVGDLVHLDKVNLKQHHTQPPPRYSEGALVKKLEELGIGRPSTYATIIKVLQDRNYMTVKSRVLYPEFRGRMVSAFLSDHFSEVTDYSFTADMENELDNVSVGKTEWKGLLKDYWSRFSVYCDQASRVDIRQVEKMLQQRFEGYLFGSLPETSRSCPSCLEGKLIFKVSRFGAGYFIGCDQHPKCKYIARTIFNDDDEPEIQKPEKCFQPRLLGLHPGSEEKIYLKDGPYGFYIQLGDDRKGHSPKRVAAHLAKDMDSITLDDAIALLKYPLTLGQHPEDGLPVIVRVSRGGFSVKHRRTNAVVPKSIKPQQLTLEKALKLLSSKDVTRTGRPSRSQKNEEALEDVTF